MATTITEHLSSHTIKLFCVYWKLLESTLSIFQIYKPVLLAIVTMWYITSLGLIYFLTGSLYLLTTKCPLFKVHQVPCMLECRVIFFSQKSIPQNKGTNYVGPLEDPFMLLALLEKDTSAFESMNQLLFWMLTEVNL